MNVEDRLRYEFAAWADEAVPDAGRDLSAKALTDALHRRLRYRAAMVAAGLTALLVVIAVPVGLTSSFGGLTPRPAVAEAAEGTALFDMPTRGPLAGDAGFIADVTALPWIAEGYGTGPGAQVAAIPDPAIDTRHVVWAGDVSGALRVVVVSGENTAYPTQDEWESQTDLGALSSIALAVYVGPPGASVEELRLAGPPHGQTEDQPFAIRDTATGAVLIIAAPGDRIEISPHPIFQPDGTQSRDWQVLASSDGVGALQMDNGTALAYRVLRNGTVLQSRAPSSLMTGVEPVDEVPVTAIRTLTGHSGDVDAFVQTAARHLVEMTGLPQDQVQVAAPWEGNVPSRDGVAATLTVTTATLPSTAVIVEVTWSRPVGGGGYGISDCGQGWHTTALPGGPPVGERTLAFRCTVGDLTGDASANLTSLVIVAPTSAATIRLLDATGAVVADQVPLDAGVLVTANEDLVAAVAAVEAFTADGVSLGQSEILAAP